MITIKEISDIITEIQKEIDLKQLDCSKYDDDYVELVQLQKQDILLSKVYKNIFDKWSSNIDKELKK